MDWMVHCTGVIISKKQFPKTLLVEELSMTFQKYNQPIRQEYLCISFHLSVISNQCLGWGPPSVLNHTLRAQDLALHSEEHFPILIHFLHINSDKSSLWGFCSEGYMLIYLTNIESLPTAVECECHQGIKTQKSYSNIFLSLCWIEWNV